MNIYKIIIQYKGTGYLGFQVQAQGKTIQGEINSALSTLSKSHDIKSLGSGRTDAGVHALGQVLRVEMPLDMPAHNLVRAMNSNLPVDIRVLSAEISDSNFHPIFNAKTKEYNYVFSNDEIHSPFANDLMTYFPGDLDFEKMKKGCQLFCGEHDFSNYQCVGTEIKNTVRNIFSCDLVKEEGHGHWKNFANRYYIFKIVGSGFLKQMVRLQMGALISLGKGKISLEDLQDSLISPLKNRLGPTAPPQGLYLKEVSY